MGLHTINSELYYYLIYKTNQRTINIKATIININVFNSFSDICNTKQNADKANKKGVYLTTTLHIVT